MYVYKVEFFVPDPYGPEEQEEYYFRSQEKARRFYNRKKKTHENWTIEKLKLEDK